MKTIFYNDYVLKHPQKHPTSGDVIFSMDEDDGSVIHHWPMAEESAEAFYEALGELLGKGKPHIVMPTPGDIRAASVRPS